MAKDTVEDVATWLVLIGGLNWGLVGFFGFNLVDWLAQLVNWIPLTNIVYGVVGVSALYVGYKKLV